MVQKSVDHPAMINIDNEDWDDKEKNQEENEVQVIQMSLGGAGSLLNNLYNCD